jgi:hypothetical protein
MTGNLDNSDVNDYLELGMNLHGQSHIIRRQVCVYIEQEDRTGHHIVPNLTNLPMENMSVLQ